MKCKVVNLQNTPVESLGQFGQVNPLYQLDLMKGDSVPAYSFLKEAMQGAVSMKDFPNAQIDLTQFNWADGSDSRHWWWQLQQFPFVRWYIQSITLIQKAVDVAATMEFLMLVIQNWRDQAGFQESISPLAWHDHAVALRLRNLVNLRATIDVSVEFPSVKEFVELLENLCLDHVSWLSNSKNYTRYTNHGFEQSESLYRCGVAYPNSFKLARSKELGYRRLLDELSFAFTAEGVHKENSPGYQKFMLSRLGQLSELAAMDASDGFPQVANLMQRASDALVAMSLPDGTLPIIGDTRADDRVTVSGLSASNSQSLLVGRMRIYDYSNSGYLIVEYNDAASNLPAKLILKCAHLSDYHRHDDDLMIYWQIGSDCVIGDGGLYSHNERDPIRRYLRSWHAHSCIGISGLKAVRKKENLDRFPIVQIKNDPLRFIGVSFMYSGIRIRRVINISRIEHGDLIIEDRMGLVSEKQVNAYTNWLVPDAVTARQNSVDGPTMFTFPSGGSMDVRHQDIGAKSILAENSTLIRGFGEEQLLTGLISRSFNMVEPCWRLMSYWPQGIRRRTTMKWRGAEFN